MLVVEVRFTGSRGGRGSGSRSHGSYGRRHRRGAVVFPEAGMGPRFGAGGGGYANGQPMYFQLGTGAPVIPPAYFPNAGSQLQAQQATLGHP
jgi:hypothetical protein